MYTYNKIGSIFADVFSIVDYTSHLKCHQKMKLFKVCKHYILIIIYIFSLKYYCVIPRTLGAQKSNPRRLATLQALSQLSSWFLGRLCKYFGQHSQCLSFFGKNTKTVRLFIPQKALKNFKRIWVFSKD